MMPRLEYQLQILCENVRIYIRFFWKQNILRMNGFKKIYMTSKNKMNEMIMFIPCENELSQSRYY